MDPGRPLLVTGATGLVGSRLLASLRAEGRPVRALTRDPAAAGRRLGAGVEPVAWDGIQAPPAAVDGTAAVVHLSGDPIFAGRLTAARKRSVFDSRVASARSLAAAIDALPEAARPEVFVCASAVGYYGDRGDELLDEEAGPGRGFLADLCREWEAAAFACGVRSVALRLAIVLAAEAGALPRMALPFRLGLGGRLGNGRQWFPWIHVEDLVAVVRRALVDPTLRGAVNAAAPEPVRNADLTAALAAQLHRPALLAVPAPLLRLALGELAEELLGSRRVVPRRLLERGFDFGQPSLAGALAAELGGGEKDA